MQASKIHTSVKVLSLLLGLFMFVQVARGQTLSVTNNSINELDLADKENIIEDINGEICSMVIFKTDIDSLKFYTNRGVERVEEIPDGYKIWIPGAATVLKISVPGFPLYEYNLPESGFKYSVYIFILNSVTGGNVQIVDTLNPVLSFDSEPEKARVYVNDRYIGKTPLKIEDPEEGRFNYRFQKKTYRTVNGTDSIFSQSKNIMAELENLSAEKRVFFMPLITIPELVLIPESGFHYDGATSLPLGIMFGTLGRTGWYAEGIIASKEEEYNLEHNKMNKILINGGVTQQIGRNVFLNGGGGYIRRKYTDYNDENSENDFLEKGINLETGISLRIPMLLLLNLNGRLVFIFDQGKLKPGYYSIGIGIGMNFNAEKFSEAFK